MIYEGEYSNNQRIGNGKEYYNNDKLKYEGNTLKGNVKEYYDNGQLKFEGEYIKGKRNGYGKEYKKWYFII